MWESAEPLRMQEREGGGAQEGCLGSPRNGALAEGSPHIADPAFTVAFYLLKSKSRCSW